MSFVRDPDHWLYRLSPREWISAAMAELERAKKAYAHNDARGGLAGAKRAAGMALNGALVAKPNPGYGRSYVEHVVALAKDDSAPLAVRSACKVLIDSPEPGKSLLSLRTKKTNEKVLEAAQDVMAHAFAIVLKAEPWEAGDA